MWSSSISLASDVIHLLPCKYIIKAIVFTCVYYGDVVMEVVHIGWQKLV